MIAQGSASSLSCAKTLLSKQLGNPLLDLESDDNVMRLGWSDDIKCARALIYHSLGQAQAAKICSPMEAEVAVESLQRTLELFEQVSNEGVKLKFLNVV